MNRRNRRRNDAPRATAPAADPRPARDPGTWAAAIGAALLAGLAAWPDGPLAFLPAVVRFPLAAAAAIGWALARADRQGRRTIPMPVRGPLLEAAGLALLLGTFLLIKLPGIHASATDDNIYYYMADAMTRGRLPYRDFFFSHPPVHLLVPAAVFGVGGFSIGLAKSIPVLATVAAAVFLYLAARRSSRGFALLVVLFHLSTYQVLMASSDMNGENLMTAFLAAGLWALVAGRPLLAGAMAGLGLGCGLYALAAVLALGVAAASRRSAGRFAAGFAATFGGVMLAFWALAPDAFVDGVFRYHLAKPIKAEGRTPVFESANPLRMASAMAGNLAAWLGGKDTAKSLYYHAVHALGLGIAAAGLAGQALRAWLRAPSGRTGTPRPDGGPTWRDVLSWRELAAGTPDGFAKLALLSTALFALQWSAVQETYDFYQVPMLALMAFLPAWAAWRVFTGVRDARRAAALAVPAVVLALMCLHLPWSGSLSRRVWPAEHAAAGEVVRYEWRDPAVLPGLARVGRALFFADTRVRGRITPHYRHAIWNKMLTFTTAQAIADHVRATTAEDETITGASTIAPLVALLAGRRMAGDEADTNGKRFTTGTLTMDAFRARICGDRVRTVVGAPRSPFNDATMSGNPAFAGTFVPERTFQEPGLLHFRTMPIRLYRRVEAPDAPPDRVCMRDGETDRPGNR